MKTKSDKVITVVTIDRDAYQQKVMEVLYKKNSFPKYKRIQRMFIKNKYNSNKLYTVT
jgi:F0F1-type ATP synthase delta subunit